ncbi:MAG: hypothetical protein HXX08_09230 [Chloroflexi bacterium]|uniref:Uncharacterized protein n=1 Tax=Candidatus Chlorohelix allophototropha TaxID=3003348 RepID=A0A8T7M358_9CHLR|nr:hypothetical protein [Chloroflexota bacterium]WJW67906.1 hypothetical protein OZ401_001190 [Chloroflexota bacterium L227-S17]
MSHIDDLIELIQTTNEIYLLNVNPERHVKSVFIQIDDLCELTLKSWLIKDSGDYQQQCLIELKNAKLIITKKHQNAFKEYCKNIDNGLATFKNDLEIESKASQIEKLDKILTDYPYLEDWSADISAGKFKSFSQIVEEVKNRHLLPANQLIHSILHRIKDRRNTRNSFFHDPNSLPLTINSKQCLNALCDLYEIINLLFPNALIDLSNQLLRVQIATIRALRDCADDEQKDSKYKDILNNWKHNDVNKNLKVSGEIKVKSSNRAYQYCIIHLYADQFYSALLNAGLISE